ncbi:hypothetical protein WICPIJ_006364 [Wickerhamomyces pijperi]|uniref:Uncharacterized protein n=1 Tax=Wickerhamomyces pijperi TaxID=599730 RepID=A0A9P8TL35_WICPI|nr:hypothetical protein WICPIJ_006364 [Wickerhamomyces pijperi]
MAPKTSTKTSDDRHPSISTEFQNTVNSSSSHQKESNNDSLIDQNQQKMEDLLNFEGESTQMKESEKVIKKIQGLKNKKNHSKEEEKWIEENYIIYHNFDG